MALKTKKNGEPRAPVAGRANPLTDQRKWRKQLQRRRVKFDDLAKSVYLAEIAKHGRRGEAARAANICNQTASNHLENDPEFQEAYDMALEAYRDRVVGHSQRLALEGIEVRRFDAKGNIIEERRDYPVKLIEMELKKVAPEDYRDKQTLDLNHSGGVMVAPAEMTPEEWIKAEEERNTKREAPAIGGG